MSSTLSPTKRKKLVSHNHLYFNWDRFTSKPSIKVKTSCPPSNKGNGNELRTAKLIEIKAANNNIPVPLVVIIELQSQHFDWST